MSDEDYVSRSGLLAEYDRQHEGPAGKARKLIEDAPAVPQEMTARELLLIENRMLSQDDYAYSEYSHLVWGMAMNDAVAFAERWAREHPEERSEE